MNRRSFLASFAAACAFDPERLLWVPDQKTISIPAKKEIYLLEYDGRAFFVGRDTDGRLTYSAFLYLGHYVNGNRVAVESREVAGDALHPKNLTDDLRQIIRLPRRKLNAV